MSSARALVIDVLGGGSVGGALAAAWRGAGHDVQVVGRGGELRSEVDAVLVAVPAAVAGEVVAAQAEGLADRLLIDATNDVSGAIPDMAAVLAAAAPRAHVAKAFNTVFATFYERPVGAEAADLVYCTDAQSHRATLEDLIRDAGFRPIDAGPLAAARDLEGMARMVIRTAHVVGRGPFTYRFSTREEHQHGTGA